MKEDQIAGKNKVITMQYSLTNSEGVVVREAGDSPVNYLHATEALFGKLEREIQAIRNASDEEIQQGTLSFHDKFCPLVI